ncbi:MAG: helix-turn-helix transcriptional regulator [Candidatus Omnitrophica bacterium]|nr:helix-turn-helix transcriptional regulator [Candidatus Omnitrophota bacterium]
MAEFLTVDELKALRVQLKVSLLELAANTGLPEGYLSQIECREVKPSISDLERMAKALRRLAADAGREQEAES